MGRRGLGVVPQYHGYCRNSVISRNRTVHPTSNRGFGISARMRAGVSMSAKSEAAVLAEIRLKASAAGWRLFRNNSGAAVLKDGSFVRWGLANDTPHSQHASADLIGIRPVVITQDMVGTVIGQFVSVEAKCSEWKPRPNDKHEQRQRNWRDLVRSLGGYAIFSTGEIEE